MQYQWLPIIWSILFLLSAGCTPQEKSLRPNILFCIADDWGWPHAGVYGDKVVQTPAFDRIAREGMLFNNAYISSPSCTPSRGAILSGQHFWRLEECANLWSTLDVNIPVFPRLLEDHGYAIGAWRKAWGPGNLQAGGYAENEFPTGEVYGDGFASFLDHKAEDQPFCFWLGASDPHRPYEPGIGSDNGIDPSKITIPGFYPDHDSIRQDIADYYFEVNRFDSDVGEAIAMLEEIGELDNTIIVITGDHGMPFPRCKGNVYDWGARVPLAVRWGNQIEKHQVLESFVSLTDLAPTFLEVAGVPVPEVMTGKSLAGLWFNKVDQENRDFVVFGRERHTPAQASPSLDGYPVRAIRTAEFLYIHNYAPDRWPAGVPEGSTHPIGSFADCDAGPTKTYLVNRANDPEIAPFYKLSFAQRPQIELYAIQNDPYQINNLADVPQFEKITDSLGHLLTSTLQFYQDPRETGEQVLFDEYPYRSRYQLNR